jgi:hypothetical protein
MMIWRLHDWKGDLEEEVGREATSQGYHYFHTRREAVAEAERMGLDLTEGFILEGVNVRQGKDALIKILRRWGCHNDNG